MLAKEKVFSPPYPGTLTTRQGQHAATATSSVPPGISVRLGEWVPSQASALLV